MSGNAPTARHTNSLSLGARAGAVWATYILALIAMAPAGLISAGLHILDDRLHLAEARGTLWSGSGQFQVLDQNGFAKFTKHLDWRVQPHALIGGKLLYEVELDDSGKRFPMTISPLRIHISNAEIELTPAVWTTGIPGLEPLRLSGVIVAHVGHLSLNREGLAGDITVNWYAAASPLSSVSPLGDYELRYKSNSISSHAVLRTLAGPVQLAGESAWTNGERPTFPISINIALPHRRELAPLLRMMSSERAEGVFELRLE